MTSDARALLTKYDLRAKKNWSQNFLVEERAFAAIVDGCRLQPEDWAIEIGAGLGTLTARLADAAAHVVAVERERDMLHVLRSELADHPRIELVEADALQFDYAAVATRAGRKPIVVGNLPYAISTPIMFRLFEQRRSLQRIVVMLQKEMVDRIVAPPGTKEYGALSVMVRLYGEPRMVCRVRAGSFIPAPRVDSAVLRIELYPDGATKVAVDEAVFSKVVHAAFNQRRKTLRNALQSAYEVAAVDRALAATGIDGQRRGETLTVEEFARVAKELALHA
jgi:16S rRNA (adenine1518-N6/adenine1519-N6)-dimethyltransferase